MKPVLIVVLGLSIAANAVLALVAMQGRRSSSALQAQASAAETAARSAAEQRSATEAALVEAKSAASRKRSEVWSSLASDDLPTLVENLRAAGFPDQQVRAIVGTMVNERFAAERRRLLGEDQVVPFWKPQGTRYGYDGATTEALRKLSREQRDLMKQLFGEETTSPEMLVLMQRRYGPLAPDRIEAIRRIEGDYSDLAREVRGDFGGILLPEDRENLAMLEKEKRKDLAALLSPAELETYDLYASNTANNLRRNLDLFAPTEQEFRAIFALQRDYDEATQRYAGGPGLLDESAARQRREAEQALQEKVRAALGDQRYEEYQRARDTGYRAATRIAERYGLPAENAVAVYNLQREAQQRAGELRRDREAAAAYAKQTSEKISQLLGGARGLEAYRSSGAGFWLRGMERGVVIGVPPRP